MIDYDEFVSRNRGLITPEEQECVAEARILMAGIGAEGGATASCLARLGFRRFRLADVDDFEVSNLNRQFGAYADTVGKPKVEGLADELRRINPDMELEQVFDGVTAGNAAALVDGVACILNGIDLFALEAAKALDAAAREAGVVIVGGASVGFRSDLYAYHPERMGIVEYIERTLAAGRFPWVPPPEDLPPSAPPALVERVIRQEIPAPVIAPAVFLTGARAATAVLELVTDRREPLYAPQYSTIDLTEMTATVRHSFPEGLA